MRFELPAYSDYQPAVSEWIGVIPAHWKTYRLKFIAKLNPSKGASGYKAADTEKVVFLPMECVSTAGAVDQSNRERICDLWKGFTYFAKGDVVIAKITPCFENGKGALLSDLETDIGFGTTEFHVVRANLKITAKFLYLITASQTFRGIGERFMIGAAGQQRVSQQFIADFPIALPPMAEQRAILAFLDRETAKIDRLMAVRQKQVECLQEQRTAIIHHAVTKGLDPLAMMKPSGVEWLGDIPLGWKTNKLRFLVKFRGGGTPSKGNADYWSGDIPWVSPKDMKSLEIDDAEDHISPEALADSASSMVEKGCVLIVVRSGILRRCIPVAMNTVEVALNQDMKALRANKIDARFLMFFILGNQDQLLVLWRKQGSTVESLEQPQMGGTFIVLPPATEQEAIVAHIDRETGKLDTLIAKYQRELELLAEYRASLISHAVTGKIDVRSLVEPQSLETA